MRVESILDAMRGLKRRQIGLLAAVVVGSFGLTYGMYAFTESSGQEGLLENQRLIPVQFGNLANDVAINGSLVFSSKETLTFGSPGFVDEILVEEGQEVTAGQPLVSLDPETIAEQQQAVAQARIDLLDAESALSRAESSALAQAEAEAAISDARLALKMAQDELDALLNPAPKFIAEAEAVVVSARIALEDAEEDLSAEYIAAIATVNATTKDLEAARQDLELAQDLNAIRNAQNTYDLAEDDYQSAIKKWTGVTLTEEELALSPEDLFESWGLDIEAVYDSRHALFPDGKIADSPATRWNELVFYAWRSLYPNPDLIVASCSEDEVLGRNDMCIEREIDEAWEVFDEARNDLLTLQNQAEKSAADAEARIIRFEEDLAEAQKVVNRLAEGGLQSELLIKNHAAAQASLAQVEEDLSELLDPDPAEMESARNKVAVAEATLAQAEYDLAQVIARKGLDVALREAEVASVRTRLSAAILRYEDSTLKAPRNGFVSIIRVEEGQEVAAADPVIEIIDPTIVRLDGVVDQIDVLSLRQGAQALVTMDALSNQTLSGVVTNIGSEADNQQGVVTFGVEIEVEVPEGLRLQEGLSAVATVALGQEDGLLVPNQAINGTFNDPRVTVMNGSGRLEERPVTLGNSDGFWTVVQDGLAEGEQVVMQVQETQSQQVGFRGVPSGGRTTFRAAPAGGR